MLKHCHVHADDSCMGRSGPHAIRPVALECKFSHLYSSLLPRTTMRGIDVVVAASCSALSSIGSAGQVPCHPLHARYVQNSAVTGQHAHRIIENTGCCCCRCFLQSRSCRLLGFMLKSERIRGQRSGKNQVSCLHVISHSVFV